MYKIIQMKKVPHCMYLRKQNTKDSTILFQYCLEFCLEFRFRAGLSIFTLASHFWRSSQHYSHLSR